MYTNKLKIKSAQKKNQVISFGKFSTPIKANFFFFYFKLSTKCSSAQNKKHPTVCMNVLVCTENDVGIQPKSYINKKKKKTEIHKYLQMHMYYTAPIYVQCTT